MIAFQRMLRCRSGVGAAEYAMILAVIGSVIAFGAMSLSNAIGDSIGASAQRLEDCRDGC